MCAALCLGTTSCGNENDYLQEPVAAYDGRVLTRGQLNRLLPESFDSPQDSVRVASLRIEEWQKNQALADEALSRISGVEDEIEPLVEDYRNKLLVEAMHQYIYENLVSSEASASELEKYYKKNIEQFITQVTLFDYYYIKTSKTDLNNVVSLMSTDAPQAKAELRAWARDNAKTYDLDDAFAGPMEIIPLEQEVQVNFSGFPPSEQVYSYATQENDTLWQHLFKMRRVVAPGNYIPLDAVREKVRRIIIAERRNAAVKEYESRLFEEARAAKEFELP